MPETAWRIWKIGLRQKVVHDVGIVPHQDSPHVTNDFPNQTWHHTTKEGPCSTPNSQEDLGDQNQQKDDQVDSVAAKTGSVMDGLPGCRTGWCASKGTVFSRHADSGLVGGVLEGILNECCARDIPLCLEMLRDIVKVWRIGISHCGGM